MYWFVTYAFVEGGKDRICKIKYAENIVAITLLSPEAERKGWFFKKNIFYS